MTAEKEGSVTTEIVAFDSTAQVLNDLTRRHSQTVYDVTTADGMDSAKSAYKEINAHSIALEKARKKEKESVLTRGRLIDSEAKKISTELDALRLPIKDLIDQEEDRQKELFEAKLQAERDAIAAEEAARKAAEQKILADQQAEIDRQKKEIDAKNEALRKEEQAAKDRIAKAEREAAQRIADQQKVAQDEIDAQNKILEDARIAKQLEQQKIQDEKDRLARAEAQKIEDERLAEQRKKDEEKRLQREEEENIARAAQRAANEISDGYEMLSTFVTRFSSNQKFASVCSEITAFIERRKAA